MSTAETLTLAFADVAAGIYGWARRSRDRSLSVLLRPGVEVSAGGEDLRIGEGAAGWEDVDVELEPVGAPIERRGGPPGVEQLVRVRGTVQGERLDALGQLGQTGGESDLSGLSLLRSVGVWLGAGDAIVLEAERPAKASHHGDERVWTTLLERGEPVPVQDPRFSTTYDGEGRQRRAGMELWLTEEAGYPVRAAGEAVCGTSVDLGELVLDLAFMRWHSGGAVGVGPYGVLRPTAR